LEAGVTKIRLAQVDRAAQRVLAISLAETLRPVFLRWATDESRQYYEQTVESLWSSAGATLDTANVLATIKRLPEANHDDSHHREYYVMLCIGVLHCTVKVVGGGQLDADVKELDSLSDLVSKQFEVGDLLTQLGLAARRLGVDVGSATAASQMRVAAKQVARSVNEGLEREARELGWPADREPTRKPD
jgi:hypothetical protein